MAGCHYHQPQAASSCHKKSEILKTTEERMGSLFTPNQVLGRLHTIGCVAVEITQKCNLDCTLCYLSEHSQAVKDIPLQEVYNRLDNVLKHYGKGTHVQITGGDPTMRKHTELIEIVAYARNLGLYPALFTNGIAASRELLTRLAEVGLCDVAFHIDTTQRRKEGETETELNSVRELYLDRAKGLGLHVMFNTTVHHGNFKELPELAAFFTRNAKEIGLVSFQLQAETGRGEWGSRDFIITQKTVQEQLEKGMGGSQSLGSQAAEGQSAKGQVAKDQAAKGQTTEGQKEGGSQAMPWGAIAVGHGDCHNYMPTLVSGGRVFPLVKSADFFGKFTRDFSDISWDRLEKKRVLLAKFLSAFIRKPAFWGTALGYAAMQVKTMLPTLLRNKGRVYPVTFFIQNFMDANELVQERVDACSFMVMTDRGPVSMCEHNANRDEYILKPLSVKDAHGNEQKYIPLKELSS